MRQAKWYEVWIEGSSDSDFFYVLLLQQMEDNLIQVVDSHEGGKVVETFGEYEEAVHWMCEDEYELVEGRWISTIEENIRELINPCWFEVWIKPASTELPLLRVLRSLPRGIFEILDPHSERRVMENFVDYEKAKMWLQYEQYKLIEGRLCSSNRLD